jgi:aspartyl protease family protein
MARRPARAAHWRHTEAMNELPRGLKIATVWLLLGVGLFMAVQAWQAERQAMRFSAEGGQIEIQRGNDGHYHWPGAIDGRAVEFLVDTGATGTAIPERLARELGLRSVGTVQSRTANGVATGSVVVGDLSLRGGVRAERLRMVALPGLEAPLLGMDVLGRLRWQQSDGSLRVDLGQP